MSDRPLALVLACAVASAAWVTAFALAYPHGVAPWVLAALGVVITLLLHARVPSWRAWWRPSLVDVLWGIGVGGALIGATYALYPLAVALLPALEGEVRTLYASAFARPRVILPALVLVVVAEETIWRGALLSALRADHGALTAVLLSAVLYAVAQAGPGSVVLVAAAFALGIVWGALATITRGLTAPLVAHLMWTLTVLVLLPLTER